MMINKPLRWLLWLGGLLISNGCHDEFLDRPPEDAIILDDFYTSEAQVNAATAVLYGRPWFSFNDKAHWAIGDAMAGNHWTNDNGLVQFFSFNLSADNFFVNSAWYSLWGVVANANAVINDLPSRVSTHVSPEVATRAVGEARFIRAVAYFYLVRLWGAIPIVENNVTQLSHPEVPRYRVEDVYRLIVRDLEAAATALPIDYPAGQAGRATTWSARAMLAKVYLCRSGYGRRGGRDRDDLEAARDLAQDVLDNSGSELVDNYASLFEVAHENNAESLFALQWVSCQEWGTQNTNQAYFAPTGEITGGKDGWGGYSGPTIDLQETYEAGDRRKSATIMTHGVTYPELVRDQGGYTYTVAPDDGDSENATFAAVKKYVIGSTADNRVTNAEPVCHMSSPLNTYVQRLADVYLILAEAILGDRTVTADPAALAAINRVRARAGLDPLTVLTLDDIMQERRVEFAYEADYWYDLVRLHYYNPDRAIRMISQQERGTRSFNADGTWRVNTFHYTPSSQDFTLPYPAGEIDQSRAPEKYYF